ncbi:MAG: hypothetical protein R3314_05400, partial [Longimicrobiales bacterium]|nr:hypothetical protein [Longimicrobiales bacterium]
MQQPVDTSSIQEGLAEVSDSLAAPITALANLDWRALVNWPALAADLLQVAFILFLSLVGYRLLRVFTKRLQRESEEEDLVRKRQREQRAQTVASLLNNIGGITIGLIALLMIVGTFMPIGPLLAGVGVLGL